jgi:MFS family permease
MFGAGLQRRLSGIADPRLLQAPYRARLLVLLFLVATLNFVDRAVLSATVDPIKQELGLSDGQVGLLQGLSFALLYSLLGIPVGRLAERYSRILIIAVSTAFFSLMTVLCGISTTFIALFLCRVGVGIGEAGFMSPTSSLVGDHYPASRRASALSIIMLGSPAGFLIGAILGGWIAQHFGWRTAFLAMGVPGLIVAALLMIVLTEPSRGLADGTRKQKAAPVPLAQAMKALFAKPAYRHLLVAGALSTFGMTAIGQFNFPFFLRVHHLTLSQTGMVAGITTAVSLSLGTLLGGFGADWASKFDLRWNAWLPAIGLIVGAVCYACGFMADTLPLSIAGLLLGGLALFFYYTPIYAMAQNMAEPQMRATAVAIFAMTFGLIGAGLGPTLLGVMSDRIAHGVFDGGSFTALCPGGRAAAGAAAALSQQCAEASAQGLRFALAGVTIVFVWASLHFVLAARTLRQDLFQVPAHD